MDPLWIKGTIALGFLPRTFVLILSADGRDANQLVKSNVANILTNQSHLVTSCSCPRRDVEEAEAGMSQNTSGDHAKS